MPIVRSRPLVFDDLAEIWSYIAEDSLSRAEAFIDSIDRKFHELAQSPRLGLRTGFDERAGTRFAARCAQAGGHTEKADIHRQGKRRKSRLSGVH